MSSSVAEPDGGAVRVLYIAGTGRSGSTLLARILGQTHGAVSVGELRNMLRYGYLSLPRDVRCGCGRVFASCPFWTAVRAELERRLPDVALDRLPDLLPRVDRIRFLPAIYSPWKTPRFRVRLDEVTRLFVALYRAILDVGKGRVVVDESKDLSLLYLLARLPEIELDVLHLVRDGRAVANSWMRRRRKPERVAEEEYMHRYSPLRSALDWWYRNVVIETSRRLARRYRRLRYEDLVEDPQERLRQVLEAFELDTRLEHLEGNTLHLVEPDHLAAGNPSRFQRGCIDIRPDLLWRSEMPAGSRRVVTALVWPLLLRYGYRVSGHRVWKD